MSTQKFKLALISCAVIAAFPITTLAATSLIDGYSGVMPDNGFIAKDVTATITGTDIELKELDGVGGSISESSTVTIGTDQTNSISLSTTGSALHIDSSNTTLKAKEITLSSSVSDTLSIHKASTVSIGNENTETITITSDAEGGFAGIFMKKQKEDPASPSVTLKAKNINITTKDSGVWLQSGTEDVKTPDNGTHLTISAENITINTPNGSGLRVFSNSKLDVEGNIVINAENAIDTRGNSIINVNTSGKYSTVLNGDIVFETPNTPGDAQNSGKIINSNVNVVLKGEDSSWTGRAYQQYKVNGELQDNVELEAEPYHGNVTGMKVTLSDGAHWEMTSDSFANTLQLTDGGYVTVNEEVKKFNASEVALENGVINLQGSSDQKIKINTLSGTGDVNVKATTEDGKSLTTPKLTAAGGAETKLNVNVTGLNADDIVDPEAAMKSLDEGLTLTGVEKVQNIAEGDVNGAISQIIDAEGKAQAVTISENTKLDAFGSVAALNAVAWRHELNSVSKRMGELRDAPEGVGAWARLYGSEMEYGDQNIESQNTTIQIGSDYKIGQWTVGATVGYTDGESDYDRGSSDNEAWNFGVYGTWFAENGQYVDLIAKYSRLSQDFKLDTMKGDYDNNAFVISAEYGWHLPVMEIGFIEPQVELTYGRIMGEDFTTSNGVEIEQDDFDSFIGRLGVRAGIKCPGDWGTVYARASVVHDFDGEFDATARSLKTSATADIYEDLGGTWGEFGIGANINFTKNTYMYVDAEITSGGEVDENYRWNIGVRHNF